MSLAPAILSAMLQAARDRDEYEGGGQRLSATGHCMRQQYYDALQLPGAPKAATNLMEMHDGNIHEQDIKDLLRRGGFTIGREEMRATKNYGDEIYLYLDAEGETKVTGHIDGEISGPGLHIPHLLECKSMSFMRFVDFAMNGIEQSHPDYYQQVQGYIAAEMQHPKGQMWPGCVFVVKAKDSSAVRSKNRGWRGDTIWTMMGKKGPDEWVDLANTSKLAIEVIPFDLEAAQSVVGRQAQLAYHIAHRAVPDREYKKSSWVCNWCDHKDRCWGSK